MKLLMRKIDKGLLLISKLDLCIYPHSERLISKRKRKEVMNLEFNVRQRRENRGMIRVS